MAKKDLTPETGPKLRVFFHYVIPSVFGMIAMSSASVVDGVFIGQFAGAEALAAVNLTIPLITLFSGIVVMLIIGGGVVCGKYLGEKNDRAASDTFTKTMIILGGFTLLFFAAGLIWIDPLISLLGADAALSALVKEYLFIVLFFIPGFALSFAFSNFVKMDGRPNLSLASMLTASALNIALDALFVGALRMGLTGAAFATSIAYTVSLFVALPHFFLKKARLRFVRPKGRWRTIFRAVLNGFSEFINEISAGVVIFVFNLVLMNRFGSRGVAAFSIVNYILFFGIMISYGVSDALQPLLSTNFGARNQERIGSFLQLGIIVNGGIGIVIALLVLLFPEGMINIFLQEGEGMTVETARRFLIYFWPAMLINGINIALSSYFTSLHKAAHSAAIALSRSLLLPVAFVLSLSALIGDIGIFIAIPLAEFATLFLALLFFMRNTPKRVLFP
jgi:putative MATE family efflux protein